MASKNAAPGVMLQPVPGSNVVTGRSLSKGVAPPVQSVKVGQQLLRSQFNRQEGDGQQRNNIEGSVIHEESPNAINTANLELQLLDRPNSSAAQPLHLSHV